MLIKCIEYTETINGHFSVYIIHFVLAIITCFTVNFAPLEIFHAFLLSAEFFQNQPFRKILSGIPFKCQTDWIQIRPDILSGLIWVQSVCKGYEKTTKLGNDLTEKLNQSWNIKTSMYAFALNK